MLHDKAPVNKNLTGIAMFCASLFFTNAAYAQERLHVVIAVTQGPQQMQRLAQFMEKHYHIKCSLIRAEKSKKEKITNFEGDLSQLAKCDVIVSNLYRTWAPPAQLAKLKKAFLSKPVVGLRKAHHGFQNWLDADKKVFGVDYRGHYGNKKNGEIKILSKYKDHPFFKGMKVTIPGGGCYGHRDPAPDLTVYMAGGQKGKEPHPQTWSRVVKERGGQRVFYTRYDPGDVESNPTVRNMLIHAVVWAGGRDIAKLRR